MAHYNESWNLPPLVGSCYMYGPKVGVSEQDLRATVESYLATHPEDEEAILEFAHAMGWTG
jgi:hypothetical protein